MAITPAQTLLDLGGNNISYHGNTISQQKCKQVVITSATMAITTAKLNLQLGGNNINQHLLVDIVVLPSTTKTNW